MSRGSVSAAGCLSFDGWSLVVSLPAGGVSSLGMFVGAGGGVLIMLLQVATGEVDRSSVGERWRGKKAARR